MNISTQNSAESLKKLEDWVERNYYRGYEPFDGLSSFFRPLTFGSIFLDRLLLQLIRQSPVNLRPLFGVKPLDSTIARGYMAWGYCHMLQLTGDDSYQARIRDNLDWLIENKAPGYEEYTWGKHFDFASRTGLYRAFEPILIWSALIGMAFLEAYEILGEKKYLEVAESLSEWIVKLPRNETDRGFCFGYHMQDRDATIHNSSMYGAAVLARTAALGGRKEFLSPAGEAMLYSCSRQLDNGAWLYGEDRKNQWIDNFHTGYNLDALRCYQRYSGNIEFSEQLEKGLEFYKRTFFEDDGRPKYYHDRAYPIDSQAMAQGIDTLANFGDIDSESLQLAEKVANWAFRNMRNQDGTFYYRRYPLGIKAKTPMLHWGQATMYKALALLSLRQRSRGSDKHPAGRQYGR